MKTHTANGNGRGGPQLRAALCRAIDWLKNYVSENPYTDAAIEARNIIQDLEGARMRPAVDELLTLIGQIAKSDQGLQEIHRAKIRVRQAAQPTGEDI